MIKTKLFKSGNSYAVRIPKEFMKTLDPTKLNAVDIKRVDEGLLVVLDPWKSFEDNIKKLSSNYFEAMESLEKLPLQERNFE